ncbi:MAG: S41 family peptidase, partial [Myxococcota bacterium]
GSFGSPVFNVPLLTGPDERTLTSSQYPFTSSADAFDGPIVLLVSDATVSAAENFSQMFFDEPYVTVVGQSSAATNGNITFAWLPGASFMYFTGMEVLNPDGTQLHGVGIPVDVEVKPTPAALAAGDDPELLTAIGVLSE